MIKPYKGECKTCGEPDKWIQNSRGVCTDCVYAKNHGGKSKREVYLGRSNSTKKKEKNTQFGFTSQKVLFEFIWMSNKDSKSNHYCWLTGLPLDKFIGTIFESWIFAHVLAKGRFPKWKLNPTNIKLLHPKVHEKVDNYTSDMEGKTFKIDGKEVIIYFNKWFTLQDKLKTKYNEQLDRKRRI